MPTRREELEDYYGGETVDPDELEELLDIFAPLEDNYCPCCGLELEECQCEF
jgi:hypothetical protein